MVVLLTAGSLTAQVLRQEEFRLQNPVVFKCTGPYSHVSEENMKLIWTWTGRRVGAKFVLIFNIVGYLQLRTLKLSQFWRYLVIILTQWHHSWYPTVTIRHNIHIWFSEILYKFISICQFVANLVQFIFSANMINVATGKLINPQSHNRDYVLFSSTTVLFGSPTFCRKDLFKFR